jgi:hypothetical protein
MEEFKKKKEKVSIVAGAYSDIVIIKNYLEKNEFNLYETLKMWDFKKNNTIIYKHLKDALSVRGFHFEPYIRDLLINLALKYVVNDISENHYTNIKDNIENSVINYEALCLEFV